MKLRQLRIHNYRSIKDLTLHVPDMLVLIGPNNHGKSNILRAIEFGLSTTAKPDHDDFFACREDADDELWVEMTFDSLAGQEQTTFQKYLRADKTIRIRKSARIRDDGNVDMTYKGYIDETLESGPLLGQKNVGGVLPDFFLIPAVRDLSEEIKLKTTTTFGRLLQRAVREMAEHDERFAEAHHRLQELVGDLNARPQGPAERASPLAELEAILTSELSDWGVTTSIEVTAPELEKIFELGTQLHVNDGLKTPAERKGHGLQRALLFAFVRAWAKRLRPGAGARTTTPRRFSDSVFFAIEEPELFLHPQAQRQLMASLADIAKDENHQVFVTTHSTYFVDLDHYERLAIVTKENPTDGTRVRQCARDLFAGEEVADRRRRFHMAAWVNPDRGELFFARKVVLVEGEAEKAVLPFLARKLGCFDPNVSIIDCGSKHNLPLYIQILNEFHITHCVIHDEDPLPDPIPPNLTDEKLAAKKHTFAMNDTIQNLIKSDLGEVEMLKPDFETVAGIPKSQAEKKGKALAALDHFEAMAVAELPERIVQVVQTAYRVRD